MFKVGDKIKLNPSKFNQYTCQEWYGSTVTSVTRDEVFFVNTKGGEGHSSFPYVIKMKPIKINLYKKVT